MAHLKKIAVPSLKLPKNSRRCTKPKPKVNVERKNKLQRNYLETSTTNISTDQNKYSEVSRKCGSLKVEVKTEPIEFDVEDLHHSIDIKEETLYF